MKSIAFFMFVLALMAVLAITYFTVVKSEWYGDRFLPFSLHRGVCTWERPNGRCVEDSDCCPGGNCDGFGFCKY